MPDDAWGGAAEPGLTAAAAAAWLSDGENDLAVEVAERIRREDTARADGPAMVAESPNFAELVRSIARCFSLALTAAGSGIERTDDDFVASAARMVGDGASPLTVRRAVHVVATLVTDRLLTAADAEGARATGVRSALGEIADCEFRLLVEFGDVMLTIDHEDGTRARRLRDAFLRDVLEGSVRDGPTTRSRARALGVDLAAPFAVVMLVDADEGPGGLFDERVEDCRRRVPGRALPAVNADPADDEPLSAVLVVPDHRHPSADGFADVLARACEDAGLLAMRAVAADVAALHVVYHRLRLHAPLLERCARHAGRSTTVEDLLPYRLARALSSAEADELLQAEVGPLMSERRHAAERVATWKLLVRERPTDAEAAERLGVGERAVAKRRAAIQALTGRDLRSNLFRAQVASYVLELWEDDLDPPGHAWWRGEAASPEEPPR